MLLKIKINNTLKENRIYIQYELSMLSEQRHERFDVFKHTVRFNNN